MARGYANIKFEWNGKHSAVIQNLGFGKALQRDAAQILYNHAFKYMPYQSGDLSLNRHIQAGEKYANIVHQVPYANKQYTAVNVHRYTGIHPLATSYWYDAAWKLEKREITKEVDEARLKYRNFNYGK